MVEHRLCAEERRCRILQAAKRVFARMGFVGAKTKDIAQEAQVSEALIYRHFPSKESLHEALHSELCAEKETISEWIAHATPSAELLVFLHYLVPHLILNSRHDPEGGAVARLLIQNMLEDGRFARQFHDQRFNRMIPVYAACLQAGRAKGDIRDTGITAAEAVWFLHHAAVMVLLNTMPDVPVYDYGKNHHALVDGMIRYSLRGVGLTEDALDRYYRPDKLAADFEAVRSGQASVAGRS